MNLTKSKELTKRALAVFPGGANTSSKYPNRFPRDCYPVIVDAEACYLWDADNNKYIDWTAGLGAVVLGYNRNSIYLPHTLYSTVTKAEIELAERLVDIIPCAEQVRFFKTGSESTLAAVRLARAITKNEYVLHSGYHSWHDWYASSLPTPKNMGTKDIYSIHFDYGSIERLKEVIGHYDPACIIIEPVNRYLPELANDIYLEAVRNICDKTNTILIFDEILSGFRFGFGPTELTKDIIPDLSCYSKAMGNGAAIAALVGKKEYMKEIEHLHISGTFNGEQSACNYASSIIDCIERYDVIDNIWKKSIPFGKKLSELFTDFPYATMHQFGPYINLVWTDAMRRSEFYWYSMSHGVYANDNHFMMYCHSPQDIETTLQVYEEAINFVKGI